MNTYKIKGKSRQVGAIGILESFEMAIKANSEREARDGAIFIMSNQGREHIKIESCEFGGYDSVPMYIDTSQIHNADDLKRVVGSTGSHFFDEESMRFFLSRLAPDVYHCDEGIVFITSEQFIHYEPYRKDPRAYTIRLLSHNGRISEIGEFQQYKSLAQARRGVKQYMESK